MSGGITVIVDNVKQVRQEWVDNLKGIAVMAVVAIHSGGGLPSILGKIVGIGSSGVQLFLILSAYLTWVSYSRYLLRQPYNFKSNLTWFFKKIVRLAPSYYLSLAVCGFVQGGIPYWLGTEHTISFTNMLFHVFFLHGFVPHYADSILGVEWYIGTLVIFYMLVPFIYGWFSTLKRTIICLVPITVICCPLSRILAHISLNSNDAGVYSGYFGTFFIASQFTPLMLGILLYHITQSNILSGIIHKRVFSYMLLIVTAVILTGMPYASNTVVSVFQYAIFGMGYFLLCISQYIYFAYPVKLKMFHTIGSNSYQIYLFHNFFLWVYDLYITASTGIFIVDWLIKYSVVISLSLIVSYFIQKYIENPVVQFMNKEIDILLTNQKA